MPIAEPLQEELTDAVYRAVLEPAAWPEVMLKSRNHLGMLSEDTHPITGEMWGNFPQTYSMVGIINAAVRLSAPWDSCI